MAEEASAAAARQAHTAAEAKRRAAWLDAHFCPATMGWPHAFVCGAPRASACERCRFPMPSELEWARLGGDDATREATNDEDEPAREEDEPAAATGLPAAVRTAASERQENENPEENLAGPACTRGDPDPSPPEGQSLGPAVGVGVGVGVSSFESPATAVLSEPV
jgi:hypothetical protein